MLLKFSTVSELFGGRFLSLSEGEVLLAIIIVLMKHLYSTSPFLFKTTKVVTLLTLNTGGFYEEDSMGQIAKCKPHCN